MAATKNNTYFEVILPSEEDNEEFTWTLYKGKARVVCEGTSQTIEEARQSIAEFKKIKGI